MSEEINKLYKDISKMKKEVVFYKIIFFLCFITFFETIIFIDSISSTIPLIIGTISFVVIERKKKNELKIKKRIEALRENL